MCFLELDKSIYLFDAKNFSPALSLWLTAPESRFPSAFSVSPGAHPKALVDKGLQVVHFGIGLPLLIPQTASINAIALLDSSVRLLARSFVALHDGPIGIVESVALGCPSQNARVVFYEPLLHAASRNMAVKGSPIGMRSRRVFKQNGTTHRRSLDACGKSNTGNARSKTSVIG